ncbi:phosphoenolpyruvate carboxylase family protein, partial [Tanacetum coccineum]
MFAEANMLEGGRKMPILTPSELEDIGYKVVAYPLSLMGISIRAMEGSRPGISRLGMLSRIPRMHWLQLRGDRGRVPQPGSMPSFDEVKEVL